MKNYTFFKRPPQVQSVVIRIDPNVSQTISLFSVNASLSAPVMLRLTGSSVSVDEHITNKVGNPRVWLLFDGERTYTLDGLFGGDVDSGQAGESITFMFSKSVALSLEYENNLDDNPGLLGLIVESFEMSP